MYENLSNNDYIVLEVGRLLKTVQYIEYNLVEAIRLKKVLSIFDKTNSVPIQVYNQAELEARQLVEELSNKTLGVIIGKIKNTKVLMNDNLVTLEEILRKRNDLVHHYFKRKDFEKHEDNLPFIQNEFNYLKNFNNQADAFNDFLCELIDELQVEYDAID